MAQEGLTSHGRCLDLYDHLVDMAKWDGETKKFGKAIKLHRSGLSLNQMNKLSADTELYLQIENEFESLEESKEEVEVDDNKDEELSSNVVVSEVSNDKNVKVEKDLVKKLGADVNLYK